MNNVLDGDIIILLMKSPFSEWDFIDVAADEVVALETLPTSSGIPRGTKGM